MWASIVAVAGTLAGVGLTGFTQQWIERRARRREHDREVRAQVSRLLKAVLRYRELHWLFVQDIRDGQRETREHRVARYRARSEVTEALDELALTTGDRTLLEAASTAAWHAIGLSDITLGPVRRRRFAPGVEARLAAGRGRTRDAHSALREAGHAYRPRR
ncbi:hypothetical protein ACWD33_25600 [Streptomyces xiamenensis]|uniref:Herbicide Basta/bialophos/Rely 2000/Liberty resistance protein n=1 Tax=Streptomyces xiamenensis TaxID=408015 RepID=A0A0F7FZW5_9ACTN|nr:MULTISPECIES: hypothetical protein [Streptomyces]AKG45688.1 herbicide Basta/bialophos/Rely 2000/Liberty resistance protein [Streptomyces xiamenensis]